MFQTYLDAFAEAAQSPYGCLLVAGKVAVATRKWWELSALELVLLPLLLNELTASASRDVAVFLPVTSPKVTHLGRATLCHFAMACSGLRCYWFIDCGSWNRMQWFNHQLHVHEVITWLIQENCKKLCKQDTMALLRNNPVVRGGNFLMWLNFLKC